MQDDMKYIVYAITGSKNPVSNYIHVLIFKQFIRNLDGTSQGKLGRRNWKCLYIQGVFARAIHALARVGDELFVEPSNSGVYFRTVNSSRSAFGSFFFKSSFFSLFDFKLPDAEQEDNFKCKVAMKACLNAFKSVSNIERSVEKCKLVIDPEEDRLVVNMTCRHGINKTYNLAFIECETLQAVFDKSTCKYVITSQSRVFCDAFTNFQTNQEEVTLSASPQKIVIRNYVDDDPDPAKSIHTELTLEADEFDSYRIDQNCEVTFCLKEVRSLLSFSEPSNLPICLNYTCPGSPIIFSVENPSSFEANFVLATLSAGGDTSQSTCRGGTQQASKRGTIKPSPVTPKFNSFRRPSELIDSVVRDPPNITNSSERINNISSRLEISEKQDFADQSPVQSPATTLPSRSLNGRRASFEIPSIGVLGREQDKNERKEEDKEEGMEDDEEEDLIPGTPPAKRRRFFFKRCFEPTFDANNISGFRRILAEDSDEENDN